MVALVQNEHFPVVKDSRRLVLNTKMKTLSGKKFHLTLKRLLTILSTQLQAQARF